MNITTTLTAKYDSNQPFDHAGFRREVGKFMNCVHANDSYTQRLGSVVQSTLSNNLFPFTLGVAVQYYGIKKLGHEIVDVTSNIALCVMKNIRTLSREAPDLGPVVKKVFIGSAIFSVMFGTTFLGLRTFRSLRAAPAVPVPPAAR